jgi:CRISPR-associated protein Csd1
MAVDAATTGRMAITFYQSLPQNEYLERITAWHESCCWWFWYKGNEYISAPSVDKIIAAVYGEVKGKGFLKIRKQSRERLLYHIICGESLNYSWIKAAVTRTSNPFSYTKIDDSWDFWKWSEELAVACAIVRKFYIQKKEVFALELDRSYRDRSYLFGRLLAIADRLENHARYLQNRDNPKGDNRPTNAVRYMSAFASKPLRTWELIYKQLNPYIQRLDGAEWYQDQIDECMSLFSSEDICDKSLNGKYLLGYSLQRRALKKKQEEELTDESN